MTAVSAVDPVASHMLDRLLLFAVFDIFVFIRVMISFCCGLCFLCLLMLADSKTLRVAGRRAIFPAESAVKIAVIIVLSLAVL